MFKQSHTLTASRTSLVQQDMMHGVNDIGEAYPFQEQGICQGLSERLDRGRGMAPQYHDLQTTNYELPPKRNGVDFTAEEIHPDPDKVYFAPGKESPTSPVSWSRGGWKKLGTQQKQGA